MRKSIFELTLRCIVLTRYCLRFMRSGQVEAETSVESYQKLFEPQQHAFLFLPLVCKYKMHFQVVWALYYS